MKKNHILAIVPLLTALISCDLMENVHKHDSTLLDAKKVESVKDKIADKFFTADELGPSISVIQAKSHNEAGATLSIKGFIGGRVEPFTSNRASFLLGDDSIKTCDKIPSDNCPTPWDACCEDRKKLLRGSICIQLLDNNGSLIHGNLNGVRDLKPGREIKVKGIVDSNSFPDAMLLNATLIQVL